MEPIEGTLERVRSAVDRHENPLWHNVASVLAHVEELSRERDTLRAKLDEVIGEQLRQSEAKIGTRPADVVVEELQAENRRLREALRARGASFGKTECESCGGPHQHTDPDGGTFCCECVAEFDHECAQEQEMIDALREAYEG